MPRSLKLTGRGASNLNQLAAEQTNNKIAMGKRISLENGGSQEYAIASVNVMLGKKEVLVPPNNQVSLDDQAIAILASLNCSVEGETKEFSIIATQTDTEVIENPNILNDMQYATLQNKALGATYSFPNPNDPFFELDAGLPRQVQAQRDVIRTKSPDRDVKLITTDMINWNINSNKTSTLPLFKKGGK